MEGYLVLLVFFVFNILYLILLVLYTFNDKILQYSLPDIHSSDIYSGLLCTRHFTKVNTAVHKTGSLPLWDLHFSGRDFL